METKDWSRGRDSHPCSHPRFSAHSQLPGEWDPMRPPWRRQGGGRRGEWELIAIFFFFLSSFCEQGLKLSTYSWFCSFHPLLRTGSRVALNEGRHWGISFACKVNGIHSFSLKYSFLHSCFNNWILEAEVLMIKINRKSRISGSNSLETMDRGTPPYTPKQEDYHAPNLTNFYLLCITG